MKPAENFAVQLFIQGKTDVKLVEMFKFLQEHGRLPEEM